MGDNTVKPSLGDIPVEHSLGDNLVKSSLGDNPVEPTMGDNSVKPSLGDNPVEHSLGDNPVEHSLGDLPVEHSLCDNPVEPTMGDNSVKPSLGDNPVEHSLGDLPVEHSLGDNPVEPTMGDNSVKPSLGDNPVEHSLGDNPVEHSLGDLPVEHSLGDNPVEPTMGDNSVKPSLGDNSVKPSLGDNPVEHSLGDLQVEHSLGDNPVKPSVGDNSGTHPESSQNGNGCITPEISAMTIANSSPSNGKEAVKLLWQKNPGGGPLIINADGSLRISDSPLVVKGLVCDDTTEGNGDIDDSLRMVIVETPELEDSSSSDLWRNIVKYIEDPPGTVVAIQSQLHDKLFLAGNPTASPHCKGKDPDGGVKMDTHVWWRPVVFNKPKAIILLQYYGEGYRYPPDDKRSLFFVTGCESATCSFSLRPREYATTNGQFQWGKVAS